VEKGSELDFIAPTYRMHQHNRYGSGEKGPRLRPLHITGSWETIGLPWISTTLLKVQETINEGHQYVRNCASMDLLSNRFANNEYSGEYQRIWHRAILCQTSATTKKINFLCTVSIMSLAKTGRPNPPNQGSDSHQPGELDLFVGSSLTQENCSVTARAGRDRVEVSRMA